MSRSLRKRPRDHRRPVLLLNDDDVETEDSGSGGGEHSFVVSVFHIALRANSPC
jgi:hypothetical protein